MRSAISPSAIPSARPVTRARLSPARTRSSAPQPQSGSAAASGQSAQTARANGAMLRYAKGDDSAFPELYRLLAPRLYRLCRWLCAADASELFQEVFLKIHRSRATFVPTGSVFAWSAAIAQKTHVDQVRYRARRPETALPSSQLELRPSHRAHSPEAPLLERELTAELEREMGVLSDNLRVAYDLVKVRGKSYADASAALGAPIDAIKQRVHRASEEIKAGVSLFVQAC
ncbi:MAG TPA: RNA polymerase sigma factor [Polyangiaceae bacterium]|nr:RNA polymerase sigma factor [Polyangiaceae bacterium]